MLLILLLVTPVYAQEATEPPIEPVEAASELAPLKEPLKEQIQEIEEQMQVQVENTMAICEALGITCEEEAAGKLVKALNELIVTEPVEPPADTESPETSDEDG